MGVKRNVTPGRRAVLPSPAPRATVGSDRAVHLAALLPELRRFVAKPLGEGGRLVLDAFGLRVGSDVLRDLHRAEVRTAHRAEVGELGALGRQRFVVKLTR